MMSRNPTSRAEQIIQMVRIVKLVLPASMRLKLDRSISQRYASSYTVRCLSLRDSLILEEM